MLGATDYFGAAHIAAALIALIVGPIVFVRPKGTRAHRMTGGVYVLALLVVNLMGLLIFRDGISVFHLLAGISLATLAAGLIPMLSGRRSALTITFHAHLLCWSYAGLLAAAAGQAVAAIPTKSLSPTVAIIAVLACVGTAIEVVVPRTLSRYLS